MTRIKKEVKSFLTIFKIVYIISILTIVIFFCYLIMNSILYGLDSSHVKSYIFISIFLLIEIIKIKNGRDNLLLMGSSAIIACVGVLMLKSFFKGISHLDSYSGNWIYFFHSTIGSSDMQMVSIILFPIALLMNIIGFFMKKE